MNARSGVDAPGAATETMAATSHSPSPRPLLIRGRWIVTGAGDADVASDAAVLVRDGQIEAVGDARGLAAAHPGAAVLGSDTHAVMPGLVNAHHHSHGASSLQHGIPDRLLEPWIASFAAMRAGDRRLETQLAAGALLASGVTSVIDVVSATGDAAHFEAAVETALQSYRATGIRAAVAAGYSSRSLLVHGDGEDARFLASLPASVRPHAELLMSEEEYFAVMEDLHGRHAPDPRVALWFGPPGPQWVSDTLLQRASERAATLGVGVQTHVNESFYEKLHGERAYGRPTITHLAELGVLGPHFSIAHGVWLTDEEIALMADTGAAVSHNPGSNLRLHAGIAPLGRLLEAGVTVALGMDGTTLGDDADMFAEMRLAARLHRPPQLGGQAPTLADALRMATVGGARTLGAEDRLGKIAAGHAADLVLVRLDRVTWPWVAPECHPRDLVLARARAGDVDTVLVAGEIVLRDGSPTRIDTAALGGELAEHLRRAQPPPGAEAAVSAVLPHLERWYRDWEIPSLEAWTTYGSRI